MKKFLAEISSIHNGYSLRSPKAEYVNPNIIWILPEHISAQQFPLSPKIEVKLAKNITKLQEGDVLLTNRGYFKAAIFTGASYPALASSGVWIIRPKQEYLNPAFLTCWLNSSYGQKALQGVWSSFTTIKFIRKEDIEKLEIPLPGLEKQKILGSIYNCLVKQRILQEYNLNLKQQLLESAMGNL